MPSRDVPARGGYQQIMLDNESRDSLEINRAQASASGGRPNVALQVLLTVAVIAGGVANVITSQVLGVTMGKFSYMIGLCSAVAYVPVYWGILFVFIKAGYTPMSQLEWVWTDWRRTFTSFFTESLRSAPYVKLFLLAGLGDALGDVVGFICTPYVAGPIHNLLSNCTIAFTTILSFIILRRRYSFAQCLGLLGVEGTVIIGVLASFGPSGQNSTDPYFATLLGFSCVFNALAFVLKELAFGAYKESSPEGNGSLNIFIVNSHEALFQLPFTLLCVPVAKATGQTGGVDVFTYLGEGFACIGGSTSVNDKCPDAGGILALFVFLNILWNLCILLNVKYNGSLATFVALKAISPCSAVLFAYVDWPLLHKTPVATVTWFVFVFLLPCIAFYTWAQRQQQAREESMPSSATCCYPFGNRPRGEDAAE